MTLQRIVVLASGTGSLFKALALSKDSTGGEVVALIADSDVPAVTVAHELGIPVYVVPMHSDRSVWDARLANLLGTLEPDIIVSAGFMRILGPKVIERFEGLIINSHPALLPEFPGAHAVKDALDAGVNKTGGTVHYIDSGVDTGPIIAQVEVTVLPTDTEATLHERIKIRERALLVDVVRDILSGKVQYQGGDETNQ